MMRIGSSKVKTALRSRTYHYYKHQKNLKRNVVINCCKQIRINKTYE